MQALIKLHSMGQFASVLVTLAPSASSDHPTSLFRPISEPLELSVVLILDLLHVLICLHSVLTALLQENHCPSFREQ